MLGKNTDKKIVLTIITKEQWGMIQKLSDVRGVSKSMVIRQLIADGLTGNINK